MLKKNQKPKNNKTKHSTITKKMKAGESLEIGSGVPVFVTGFQDMVFCCCFCFVLQQNGRLFSLWHVIIVCGFGIIILEQLSEERLKNSLKRNYMGEYIICQTNKVLWLWNAHSTLPVTLEFQMSLPCFFTLPLEQ